MAQAGLVGPPDDWSDNNAAFTCPSCGKVFVVSSFTDKFGRRCPRCGKSKAFVTGSEANGGKAWITLNDSATPLAS